MILYQLDVKPGSVIVESGTGSGSLSHYFMRAVKPHGHLHTFDFHENRVQQARDEFRSHGLQDFVTVTVISIFYKFPNNIPLCIAQVYHRDVCELGFSDELNGKADAVFLDLPAPQLAVPHALKAMKNSGK